METIADVSIVQIVYNKRQLLLTFTRYSNPDKSFRLPFCAYLPFWNPYITEQGKTVDVNEIRNIISIDQCT